MAGRLCDSSRGGADEAHPGEGRDELLVEAAPGASSTASIRNPEGLRCPSTWTTLTTGRTLEEASTNVQTRRVSCAFLIAIAVSGCANHSSQDVRRSVTRPESSKAQTKTPATPTSDRLRGSAAQAVPPLQLPERSWPTAETPTPARSSEPAGAQERAQPQGPTRPPEAARRQGTGEPDPSTVIDWLLKERRR
jgi:hypothetical protein